MPTWPRTIRPQEASWPSFPTGLVSPGQTGKAQLRNIAQVGRRWEEVYGPLKRSDPATAGFLALVNNYWRNQTVFQIDHRALRSLLGSASGAPVVNGNGQTGDQVSTRLWPNNTTVLKAGDVIKFANTPLIYDVTADVVSNGSGIATIPINPPLFPSTPAVGDGVGVIYNVPAGTVLFTARIERLEMPRAGANEWYVGLTIGFVEVP